MKTLPGIDSGANYPKRPPFFAMKYIRMLLKSCQIMEIGHAGFSLCVLVATTEDSRRYSGPPRFWTKQLLDHLGMKYRSQLCEIRQACVKAGVLHYEPGTKSRPAIMWAVWPAAWDCLGDGFLGEDSFTQSERIPDSFSQADTIVDRILTQSSSESTTHSFLIPKSLSPTTTNAVVAEMDLETESRLLSLGLTKARETIRESLSNGTTLATITAVIDYFASRPGAWGPGALRKRLCELNAQSLAADQGWPPASPQERKIRQIQALERDRLKTVAEAQSSATAKAKEHQLELQFGPILNATTREKLEELVRQHNPSLLPPLWRYGPTAGLVRPMLLRLLATTVAEAPK